MNDTIENVDRRRDAGAAYHLHGAFLVAELCGSSFCKT
jgi:hypothetical protein